MVTRRSPLCNTCGDITLKSPTSRIFAIIIPLILFGIITFLIFYPFSTSVNDFLLVSIIILSTIIFGIISIIIIQNQEKLMNLK
jgi:hypothetical protein